MNTIFYDKLEGLRTSHPDAHAAYEAILVEGEGQKGEVLVPIGQVCKHVYVLRTGAARHYRYDEEGKEFNCWFSFEGDVVLPIASVVLQRPNVEGIELLEDAAFFSTSYAELNQLCTKYHVIETLQKEIMQLYFIEIEERLYRMQTLTAVKKYEYLLKQIPHFLQRIPQQHIASYIGISPATLSRIRHNVSL